MKNISKMRPLYDKILAKRLKTEEKTESGIILPENAQSKNQAAKVVAVGTGRVSKTGKIIPLQVKKGDIIYFGKYSGTNIDDDHVIIREDEVLGLLTSEK